MIPQQPTGGGFLFPIGGACLPNTENLMPNAPREYRAGIHEGVDFFAGFNCATVLDGTPVMAAKAGTVIRADQAFTEMTKEELDDYCSRGRRPRVSPMRKGSIASAAARSGSTTATASSPATAT